jgi:hypothetical protein
MHILCRNPSFGLATKAKGLQECGPRGSLGVTSHTPRSVRKCEEVNPHTPKTSESNLRSQNSMACSFFYIIGNLLKHRCLKWFRIAHLDIWNTSYGQKKGRESNCQFDSWPEKLGNRPESLVCRQRAIYRWKALDKSYNFVLNRTSIRGLFAKLWGSKVAGVPTGAILGLPLGSLRREKPFGCRPYGEVQSIL